MYKKSFADPSILLLAIFATFIVYLGSYYSSDKERNRFNNNKSVILHDNQESQEITNIMAWSFIIIASFGLLILYEHI